MSPVVCRDLVGAGAFEVVEGVLVHALLPPLSGAVQLDATYVSRAEEDVALQLSRAGVRLAAVLNKALGKQVADVPIR